MFSRRTVSLCLFLMVSLVVVDIFGRTVFGNALPGTVEINEYLLIIAGFMGIAQTHSVNGHIFVELLYSRCSPRVQKALQRIDDVILFLFSLVFLWAGFQKAVSAYHSGETNWFGSHVLPVWFFRWIVPISCACLCLQVLANILTKVRQESMGNKKELGI